MPILSELLYRKQRERISTGSPILNTEIGGNQYGLSKFSLSEISGPPGCGKTAILLELLLDALRAGRKCLWVNAGYRPIPWERLRQMHHFEERFEEYIDFVNVFDLAEASLLPTFAQDQYYLILIPSYHDIFPVFTPGIYRKRGFSEHQNQNTGVEIRRAARTAMFSILSQLAKKSCVVITSIMVSHFDATNRQLKILQPPLKFADCRCLVLYRNQEGILYTANGTRLEISTSGLQVIVDRQRPVSVEHFPSSCNDPLVLSSPMANQDMEPKLPAKSPLSIQKFPMESSLLASDPPESEIGDIPDTPDVKTTPNTEDSGIVLNSQLEYADFPIRLTSQHESTSPATGGW